METMADYSPYCKLLSVAPAAYACDTTGTVTLINTIAQGYDEDERVGRKVYIEGVRLHGFIEIQDTTTNTSMSDVFIVWDRAPNGALPSLSDIVQDAQAPTFINDLARHRFELLGEYSCVLGRFDETHSVAHGGPALVDLNFRVDGTTIYSGAGAAIGDIESGALYLVTIGSEAVNSGSILVAAVRVYYSDH